jgi:hypothetical protein
MDIGETQNAVANDVIFVKRQPVPPLQKLFAKQQLVVPPPQELQWLVQNHKTVHQTGGQMVTGAIDLCWIEKRGFQLKMSA